jgi:hypothetical protein
MKIQVCRIHKLNLLLEIVASRTALYCLKIHLTILEQTRPGPIISYLPGLRAVALAHQQIVFKTWSVGELIYAGS